MASDWHKLRSLNGSQEKAFEELCCQLAEGEPHAPGSTFIRKGTPDAGVECFWILPSGDEVAWQAKFFLAPPSTGQWSQIDRSVEAALERHSRLKRYVVCLPIDRSDARIRGSKSFLDRWNERVRKWREWAGRQGLDTEFDYWGDYEVTKRLGREENRGRHWFWFGSEQLTLPWFERALEISIRNAGERYTPATHVQLPITSSLQAVGRTPTFYASLNEHYQSAAERVDRLRRNDIAPEFSATAGETLATFGAIAAILDALLFAAQDRHGAHIIAAIPIREIASQVAALAATLRRSVDNLQENYWKLLASQHSVPNGGSPPGESFDRSAWLCNAAAKALESLAEFCRGSNAELANHPALLLVGEAGQGKTHLLCDASKKDMQQGRPRILLHGFQFVDGEPWAQILQFLGLTCSRDEFLGALDAAAQAYGCRVVLLIDGLNEGPGRFLWQKHLAGMLDLFARLPRLGIVVTCRTSYEEFVVPTGLNQGAVTRLVHHGFSDHEHEATLQYFSHYGIQPTTPPLTPEFSNPLFLKLFCKGICGNGWTQVPLGIRGISAIIEMFLSAVNLRLAAPERMDYDAKSDPVRRAIESLVVLMARRNNRAVSRTEAVTAIDSILPRPGFENSLFRNLVAEGVLSENIWGAKENRKDVVTFAYERFADHLLANHLLEVHITATRRKPRRSLRDALTQILRSRNSAWTDAGLIEALSVQLPERIGKDLFELVPRAAMPYLVEEAFVESLLWRSAVAFTETTLKKVDELLRSERQFDEVLNAIVALGPIPDHPLNGHALHKMLSRHPMAKRDAWWSTFLHHEWSRERAVSRLVDWTCAQCDLLSIPEDVAFLSGTTLAWFLTSANRFLRDRATKALVRLMENRLPVARMLLERFWSVDDPYVLERLVAAAFGATMRSTDRSGLRELAEDVNEHVFVAGELLPQSLTRDHAKGLIDCARHDGTVSAEECPESKPPYKSRWPVIKVPSKRSLEAVAKKFNRISPREQGFFALYRSVMDRWLADFSIYVVADLNSWTCVRIGDKPSKPIKDQVGEFRSSLTKVQREAIERFEQAQRFARLSKRQLDAAEVKTKSSRSEGKARGLASAAEAAAVKSLRRSPSKIAFFNRVAKPYFEDPNRFGPPDMFDGDLARRWMMQRIFDYGWTADRFGAFDAEVNIGRGDRSEHKPERIGKKYQWIAYRELLARLSDNFYMRAGEYWENTKLKVFDGDTVGVVARDLDPSIVPRSTPRTDETNGSAWWSPISYSNWRTDVNEVEWLKDATDLPDAKALLSLNDVNGVAWLTLDAQHTWQEPPRPGRRSYDASRKRVYYLVRSYLVRKPDVRRFFNWAVQGSFVDGHMPEPRDVDASHLGECFWSARFLKPDDDMTWTRGWRKDLPCEVLVTSFHHNTGDSGLDCSIDRTINIKVPSLQIATRMDLRWRGREGEFIDSSEQVVAIDPSVCTRGPGALLLRRDQFLEFLQREDLELIWLLRGEKQRLGGFADGPPGALRIFGAFRHHFGEVQGDLSASYVAFPTR